VARYATAEEWASVDALLVHAAALEAALAEAEAVVAAAEAYVLWEARVGEPGRVVEDWHEYMAIEVALCAAVYARRAATASGRGEGED
jgi:hypothetical protein